MQVLTKRGLRSSRHSVERARNMRGFRLPAPPNPHGAALLQTLRLANQERQYDKVQKVTSRLTSLLNMTDEEMAKNIKFVKPRLAGYPEGSYLVVWRPTSAEVGHIVREHERLWHRLNGTSNRVGDYKSRLQAGIAAVVEAETNRG